MFSFEVYRRKMVPGSDPGIVGIFDIFSGSGCLLN